MKLLILAGGLGTRLRPAVNDVPKALAPVFGVPFLHLQLENWTKQGFDDFYFLLHHKADQIIDFVKTSRSIKFPECKFHWCVEEEPFGTGGAIANAVREFGLEGDFLVVNADTWLGDGLRELMTSPSPAIGVVFKEQVDRYGKVIFDNDSKIITFSEKQNLEASGWINSGMYLLSSLLFKSWDGRPFSLEEEFTNWVERKIAMLAVPMETEFIDIGIPSDFQRFCNWVETGRINKL